MKNKVIVLAGAMLCSIGVCSGDVFADYDPFEITSASELEACINAGETCSLANNIEVTNTITFDLDGEATIDLRMYDIYNQSSLDDIFVLRQGKLTVTGSGRVADTTIGDSDAIFHLYGTNDLTYDECFYGEPDSLCYTSLYIDDYVTVQSNNGTGVVFEVKDMPYGMMLLLNGDIIAETGIETRVPDTLPWVTDKANYPDFPEPKIFSDRGIISASNIGVKLISPAFLFTNPGTYDHPFIHGDNIGVYMEDGGIHIRNTSINSYNGNTIEVKSKNANENRVEITILDDSDIVSTDGEHAIYEYLAPGATDSVLTWLDINGALLLSQSTPIVLSEEAGEKGGTSYVSSAILSGEISEKYIYIDSFQEYNEADDTYYVREYFIDENTQEHFDEIAARFGREVFIAYTLRLTEEEIAENELEEQLKANYENAVLLDAYNIFADSRINWGDDSPRVEHDIPSDLPLRYRFNIPDAIYSSGDEANPREFHVFRIHNYGAGDIMEEIDSEVIEANDGAHALKFSTDKCSYFLISYSDGELIEVAPKVPDSGIIKDENVTDYDLMIQVGLYVVIFMPVFIYYIKKELKKE